MAAQKKKSSIFARGTMDIPFFLLLMAVVTIGLIMLFSASYTYSYYFRGGSTVIFSRQLIFTLIGLLAMYGISRIRYEYFRLFAVVGVFISIGLLVLVLILPEYKAGFKRWINLGFTTFQPSEIAKIGLILILAFLLEKDYKTVTGKTPSEMALFKRLSEVTNGRVVVYKSFTTVIGYGLLILLFAGLVYMENHVSGTVLILGLGIIMLFLGEVKYKWFFIAG